MAELAPKTALRGNQARVDRIGTLEIRETPDLSIAWVARRHGGDLSGTEAFLGARLPAPGEVGASAHRWAVTVASAQWLIVGPYDPDFADALKAAAGSGVSVCDQSDGWAVFEIRGAATDPLLERLCDLDPLALAPGCSAPTAIEHLRCVVARRAEGLTILGPRSSAGSLHHAVLIAAQAVA